MVEKEKSIEELVAELDSVATIPEDFEQPKEEPKEEKPKPKPVEATTPPVISPVIQPTEIATSTKVPEVPGLPPPPPLPQPNIEPQGRLRLDALVTKAIDKKKQQIDEKANKEKQDFENRFCDGLLSLVESMVTGSVNPVAIPTQQAPALPQIQPQPTPVVKDNSEAIRLLEAEVQHLDDQILDPNMKNLAPLQLSKQILKKQINKLKGNMEDYEPSVKYTNGEMNKMLGIEKPKTTKNNEPEQKTGRRDYLIGGALFALTVVVVFAIYIALHIH